MNTNYAGYNRIGHGPRGNQYRFEHVLVAEKILGHPLPKGAVVHHINEDKSDNRPENLVICQNRAYHALLHARMRGLDALGDANARSCRYCHVHDHMVSLKANGTSFYHASCHAEWHRNYRKLKKGD